MPMRTVRRRRVVAPEPPPRTRTVWPALPKPGRAAWALLPLGCVLLGGATERWSQALMLLVLGGGLLASPPRVGLGRGLHLVLGALALLSLTAFLPAAWFHVPAWRAALTGDFGVTLPGTLSPQPWLSAESVVLFLAGTAWFCWVATVRWTDDERRFAGILYAGGTVLLALLCVGLYRAGSQPGFWHSERRFGPFPNRNQTADFFAVSALVVLSCARAAWRAGRKPLALGWLVGWLAVAMAVFYSYSRAGIAILFVTTAVYLVIETLHRTRHQPAGNLVRWRRLAMVLSLVLVLGSGLLLFGGDTLARLRSGGEAAEANTMSNDLRRSIYADTVHLVNASPWCGNGLNTFAEIYPTSRRLATQNTLAVIHPESDWLWLAAELGWPGVLTAAAGVALVVHRLRLRRHGNDRPLRLAAALGVAGFVVHSLVDVGAHRVGSVFAALFLLGLALPGPSRLEGEENAAAALPPSPWRVGMFRALGGLFLLVGGVWLLSAFGVVLAPGEQGVERLRADALRLAAAREYPAASETVTRALAWAPLDWQAYTVRANLGFYLRQPLEDTQADFRRARFLEPLKPALPFNEAVRWATAGQTAPAVSALLEACRRDPDRAVSMMQAVYIAGDADEALALQLGAAVRRQPALIAALAQVLNYPNSEPFIAQVLRDDPELQRFGPREKSRFLKMWSQRGNVPAFLEAMERHPAWQALGWRWWAEARAREGTPAALQAACAVAERFAPVPDVPPASPRERALADWRRDAENSSYEPESALPLSRAQLAAGDAAGALRTLQQVTRHAENPVYFHYLEAKTADSLGQWNVGWAAWQRYLQAIKAND